MGNLDEACAVLAPNARATRPVRLDKTDRVRSLMPNQLSGCHERDTLGQAREHVVDVTVPREHPHFTNTGLIRR